MRENPGHGRSSAARAGRGAPGSPPQPTGTPEQTSAPERTATPEWHRRAPSPAAGRPYRLGQAALAHVAAKARQLLAVVAITALSAAMLSALAPGPASAATVGQVLFAHSLARSSLSSDYVPGVHSATGAVELPTVPSGTNAACLTVTGGAGTPASCSNASDTDLNGVLQLTPNSGDQEGALFSSLGFPTSNGLDMTFDSYQWPLSGADGLSFIVTAVNPSSPTGPTEVGQPGGSLGYAPTALSLGSATATSA